ncbi:MAG: CDP-alcohol phosphatidyltransferase family protein [Candidatus Bathyarchaeia archaeon]|jgi:phosphatidylglycerophosphate synthase
MKYSSQYVSFPWAVTVLRVAALPFLILAFNQEIKAATYALFLFAVSTDFLDGYIAKKQKTASKSGAYFDATVDFVFVSAMFTVFTLNGLYPLWVVSLICLVFGQFILTNIILKQTIYDPIGKYYGSLMYGGVGLTLLFAEPLIYSIVTWGVVISTVASLISRAYFLGKQKM